MTLLDLESALTIPFAYNCGMAVDRCRPVRQVPTKLILPAPFQSTLAALGPRSDFEASEATRLSGILERSV